MALAELGTGAPAGMAHIACAHSFDVLGDAKEYQEWLQLQSPPEPAPVEQKEPLAMSTEDLPPDLAQIVRSMEQEHAAVVLEAYQALQETRYTKQKKRSAEISLAQLPTVPGCRSETLEEPEAGTAGQLDKCVGEHTCRWFHHFPTTATVDTWLQ